MENLVPFSFFYLIFQSDPNRERVSYWVDGKKVKQVMKRETFLEIALKFNNGILYSKIYDACNTFSFYMWDAVDSQLIHLVQKIEENDKANHKNSLVTEFYKFKKNPQYSSQDALEKKTNSIPEFALLEQMGFERPSFELTKNLIQSFEDDNKSWFTKLFQ